jgi:hypothetical protein
MEQDIDHRVLRPTAMMLKYGCKIQCQDILLAMLGKWTVTEFSHGWWASMSKDDQILNTLLK